MVLSRTASERGVFQPEHLLILQRVFNHMCVERGCLPDDPEAEELALLIVHMFQAGFASETDLYAAVASRKKAS